MTRRKTGPAAEAKRREDLRQAVSAKLLEAVKHPELRTLVQRQAEVDAPDGVEIKSIDVWNARRYVSRALWRMGDPALVRLVDEDELYDVWAHGVVGSAIHRTEKMRAVEQRLAKG